MVTLLFIAVISLVALLALTGIGVYLWQGPAPDNSANLLPPPPNARGLFEGEFSADPDHEEQLALAALRREELIKEASSGERSALDEAHQTGDASLYDRVLSALVEYTDSDPKLLSVASYVAQHELPVNDELARAVIASWQQSPDRNSTAKALHFAALSNNAEIYRVTVESALQFWREAKLGDISAFELRALFDGEFWVLSSRSRSSGAGFVLKRTLESARRELDAAGGAKQ